MKRVVLATGGFDPLHSGHIRYLKSASELGDYLVVGINSDEWLTRKKGKPFMPLLERCEIIKNLRMVDQCLLFDDNDGTANDAIKNVKLMYPDSQIIFANGGDRTAENIPEMVFEDIEFVFGVGGEDKKNSSSWILKEWNQPTVERSWGKYTVLDRGEGWQVKQLEFYRGEALSNQRHFKRSEHWHVVDGIIRMDLEYPNLEKNSRVMNPGDSIDILQGTWHKAINIGDNSAKVIEVWLGKELTEDDIERK